MPALNDERFHLDYELTGNSGRRLGIERRRFSYTNHIPERRCGEDRRLCSDRRLGKDRRAGLNGDCTEIAERRTGRDRRACTAYL